MDWIQQHYELLGIAIAAIGVVLAWFQWRKREPATTAVERSQIGGSQIISGSHNKIIIAPSPLPVPRPTQPPPTERPVPNLTYAGSRRKDVFVSPWARYGICDPCTQQQRTDSLHALVVKFENSPTDHKIAPALNVIAKLKFFHKNGATERHISYGVWLNTPCNSTNIGVGDTCELVLICVTENGLVTFEDKRSASLDFDSEPFSYAQDASVEGYERVEITLVDRNSQASLTTKLKVWRDASGSFCTSEV